MKLTINGKPHAGGAGSIARSGCLTICATIWG